jgi:hypothetical protein
MTQNDVMRTAVLKGAMTFIPHYQHFDLSLPLKHYAPLPCRCPAHFVFALTFTLNNPCLTDPSVFCELFATLYNSYRFVLITDRIDGAEFLCLTEPIISVVLTVF